MKDFIRNYLLYTKYEVGILVPIEKIIKESDLNEISEFLDEDKNNKYKIELKLLPRMISKSKIYLFKNRKVSHIIVKQL